MKYQFGIIIIILLLFFIILVILLNKNTVQSNKFKPYKIAAALLDPPPKPEPIGIFFVKSILIP